jgi:hypothetical protein
MLAREDWPLPDVRHHRGAHPADAELFAPSTHEGLRTAAGDLSWLLSRGYASTSAVKVVGDRYALNARQRTAVMRCACGDAARASRLARQLSPGALAGRTALLDGYNVLITVEAALGGGVVLVGRDGCYRDMASMHGTYRSVDETIPALTLIGNRLSALRVANAIWYLDSPVSNSGRLKGVMTEVAQRQGWNWRIELVHNPDAVLLRSKEADGVVMSADSVILDGQLAWYPITNDVVKNDVPEAWVVDLSPVTSV